MRKITLALLIGGLATIQSKTWADELLADASTNFEPANRGVGSQTPTSATTPAPRQTSPASAKTSPAIASNPTSTPDVALTAQEEVVKRQAAQKQAQALIDEGKKLVDNGKYDQAVPKLETALKLLPRARATDADYSRATQLLATSYDHMALAAYNANDFRKAQEYSQKALEYDPHDRGAENMIVKAKSSEDHPPGPPPMPPPSQTPAFQAEQQDIRRLFREGKLLMNSGQYDEAEKRFQQILLVDPYNTDAYTYLNQINADRRPSATEGAEANRTRMLWEADHSWVAPVSGEVKPPDFGAPGHPYSGTTAASALILQKLNDIIFPEIKFREASITDVIQYLSDESRHLDPKKEGVNIVLGAGVGGEAGSVPPSVETPAAPAPPTTTTPAAGGGGSRSITLSLHNIPMIEALKYITSLANLKYRVESSAVLIVRLDEPEGQMITRTYSVNPNVFLSLINVTNRTAATQPTLSVSGGAGGAAQSAPLTQAGPSTVLPDVAIAVDYSNQVRQTFIEAGVQFPSNQTGVASIYYYPRNSMIILHNTVENIEIFERVLAVLNATPQLVEIEAKFVEISQSDLDELGFHWKVGPYQSGDVVLSGGQPNTLFPGTTPNPNANNNEIGGIRDSTTIQGNAIEALLGGAAAASSGNTLGSIRGILTNPQFEVIINALSQKGSADILSAPKVTTVSGSQAQIRVAQEFIYPTTYSTATVIPGQSAGVGTVAQPVVTPSTPTAFASRPVGVVFNVTPTVGADGYTISMTLVPQITDFLGFIDYGTVIASQGIIVPNPIKQPLFSVRDVVTSVVIWDGQTVVLGGLIREDVTKIDDKIPFLGDIPFAGRLFRSKVTQRTKRNLLIFVTARLIDPAGNPVHKESLHTAAR